jgi:hypothetical protein
MTKFHLAKKIFNIPNDLPCCHISFGTSYEIRTCKQPSCDRIHQYSLEIFLVKKFCTEQNAKKIYDGMCKAIKARRPSWFIHGFGDEDGKEWILSFKTEADA